MAIPAPSVILTLITASMTVALFHSSPSVLDKCVPSNSSYLNCNGAGLHIFPSDALDSMGSHKVLDFSNNHISSISVLNFSSAKDVEFLTLANNGINEIKPNAFGNLFNLQVLDVARNRLDGHTIKEEQFKTLGRLQNLSLSWNPLQFIGKYTFHFLELPLVENLDLSHCEISVIEEEAIALTNLIKLDLSWNFLRTFHESSFKMMNSLEVLDLSHNKLKILDTLPSLPEIRVLNFDNNMLDNVTIRDEVWYKADSLKEFFMRGNKLIRFTEDSFPWDLETIQGIHLEYNPIQCDCRMKWVGVQDYMHGRNYTITCEFPTEHKGKNLLTIPSNELTCSTSVFKILILTGLSLVVALCLILLIILYMKRRKYKTGKKPKTKRVKGSNYTAVYTKDEDDYITVEISDEKRLLSQSGVEFDV